MRVAEFPTTGKPVPVLFGLLRRQSYGPNLEQTCKRITDTPYLEPPADCKLQQIYSWVIKEASLTAAMLQAGRSRVQVPMRSLEFFQLT
jgi:hypothetical protein